MLEVVCLNWNNYLGLGQLYVSRLQNMVRRHLTVPHRFIEVTEHELPKGREGWFNKLALLKMFDEALYFDLDVVISGSVDHLVELGRSDPTRLWARNDFSYPINPNDEIVRDGFAGPMMQNGREATINSSVMYWKGKRHVPQREGVHGDQGCITAALWPDGIGLFPNDSIRSYKYDWLRKKHYGPVTVMHGTPKNHQVDDFWVKAHWR